MSDTTAATPVQSAARLARKPVTWLAVVYGLAVLWLAWPTLAGLHEFWIGSHTYSHGYLIALLSGWLAWQAWRRGELRASCVPSVFGLALLAFATLGTLAAHASQTQVVAQLMLPLLALGAVWAVAGGRIAAALVAPLGYVYFAIPFWDVLVDPLRGLTTAVVSNVVLALGIPAFIEGNMIHISSGSFEVAAGCSGLNFFIVSLALSAFYGLTTYERWGPRALLVAAAVGVALVSNWARVFILVVVGHETEMQHTLIVDGHYMFGWLIFAGSMVLLFAAAYWLERRSALQSGHGVASVRSEPNPEQKSLRAGHIVIAAGALLLALSGAAIGERIHGMGEPVAAAAAQPVSIPSIGSWRRAREWSGPTRPQFVGATSEAAVRFRAGEDRLGVYIAQYVSQRQGSEIVYYQNRPEGENARVLDRDERAVSAASGSITFRELRVSDGSRAERLVWYGMQIAGRRTSNDYVAKAYEALGAALGRGDAQALVLSADCRRDCAEARQRLERYARDAAPTLFQCALAAGSSEGGEAAAQRMEPCDES